MERIGFTRDDMATFGVESPDDRLKLFNDRLRPRLEGVAFRFATPLSRLAGQPFSAAITLPDSVAPRAQVAATFILTGKDQRAGPYFAFGVNRGGVHARLIIERETMDRERFAKRLNKSAVALAKELAGSDLRCYDDWTGRGLPAPGMPEKAAFWRDVAGRLAREAGSLDIGMGWPEARAVLLSYEDLLPAYRSLLPVYRCVADAIEPRP